MARNTFQECVREFHVYGVMHRTGCTKTRPATYGSVAVRTTVGKDQVYEPQSSIGAAKAFINRMMNNYQMKSYRENFVEKGIAIAYRIVAMQHGTQTTFDIVSL